MSLKNSENFAVLGLFLATVGWISAGLLAGFWGIVKDPIDASDQRNTNMALEQILPPFDNQPSNNQVSIGSGDTVISFMGAVKDNKLVAVAAKGERKGYAGPLQALVGLDPDGKIRAVLILKQNETPGLGANVCERKFKKTIFQLFQPSPKGIAPNAFLDQFSGRSASQDSNPWKVTKDGGEIEFVTGATVTSRAITSLLDEIARCFLAHREKIIQKLSPSGGNNS